MNRISVIICTYERPALLARALASVSGLAGLDPARLDVVVVDNSDSGSARAVVAEAEGRAPMPIRYVEAHPPNISVARNVGVAATESDTVAFLDDDQELAPGWLAALEHALAASPGQHVFFGPIAPRFVEGTAVTPETRAFFTRASAAAAGSELLATGRAPGQDFALSTANSIFRRASTLAGRRPFDPDFGLCGGEDLHLLCRLQREGRRFGWVPGAAASDFVPAHRCRPAYLLRRHYAGGQAYAAATIRTSGRPIATGAWLAAKALVQLAALPVLAALSALRGRPPGRSTAYRMAGIAGKLTWPRLYPLYRAEARQLSSQPHARSSDAARRIVASTAPR